MERLTERRYLPECGFYMKCTEHCNGEDIDCMECAALENLVDRLGYYEDTGLEPEQCSDAKAIIEMAFDNDMEKVEHIAELMKADKDGRVVILPCNVGDTVFDIVDGTAYETRVLSFSYYGDHWACRTVSSYPNLEDFGKRIFLTREEAEAALSREPS